MKLDLVKISHLALLSFVVSTYLLVSSGFFEAWRSYELHGTGHDPHNWQWALEQFVGV